MTSSAHVQGMEWATSIFGPVERSRNVMVLSGVLDIEDLERLGINIGSRSWIDQAGRLVATLWVAYLSTCCGQVGRFLGKVARQRLLAMPLHSISGRPNWEMVFQHFLGKEKVPGSNPGVRSKSNFETSSPGSSPASGQWQPRGQHSV